MTRLFLRETFKFNAAYRDLDSWIGIGTFKVIAATTVDCNDELEEGEEPDFCEPQRTTMLVCADTSEPRPLTDVCQALEQEFSGSGCTHEYDCCGCRSYHAHAMYLGKNRYEVVVSSSRNY